MTAAAFGKIPTTRERRLKLSCQGGSGLGVAEHGAVDGVGQVSFEDAHGFSAGVAGGPGAVVEPSGAWFAAELDHRDAVYGGVEAAVAAAAQPVSDRLCAGLS